MGRDPGVAEVRAVRERLAAECGNDLQEFRRRYAQLQGSGRSPDQIFGHLQQYAGTGGDPGRQAAALAVLSYFFERCDIFEDPRDEP